MSVLLTPPPDPAEVQLLREAVENPFVDVEEVAGASDAGRTITEWYGLAREKAPLWCFNKWA